MDSFESCKTNYYRIRRNTTGGTKRTDGIYKSFPQNVIVKLLATTTKQLVTLLVNNTQHHSLQTRQQGLQRRPFPWLI